jgi:hypothetical protein
VPPLLYLDVWSNGKTSASRAGDGCSTRSTSIATVAKWPTAAGLRPVVKTFGGSTPSRGIAGLTAGIPIPCLRVAVPKWITGGGSEPSEIAPTEVRILAATSTPRGPVATIPLCRRGDARSSRAGEIYFNYCGPVAQSAERRLCKTDAAGSSPAGSIAPAAKWREHSASNRATTRVQIPPGATL